MTSSLSNELLIIDKNNVKDINRKYHILENIKETDKSKLARLFQENPNLVLLGKNEDKLLLFALKLQPLKVQEKLSKNLNNLESLEKIFRAEVYYAIFKKTQSKFAKKDKKIALQFKMKNILGLLLLASNSSNIDDSTTWDTYSTLIDRVFADEEFKTTTHSNNITHSNIVIEKEDIYFRDVKTIQENLKVLHENLHHIYQSPEDEPILK